jgi:hypothetical protein
MCCEMTNECIKTLLRVLSIILMMIIVIAFYLVLYALGYAILVVPSWGLVVFVLSMKCVTWIPEILIKP